MKKIGINTFMSKLSELLSKQDISDLLDSDKKGREKILLRVFSNEPSRMLGLVVLQAKYGLKLPLEARFAIKANVHKLKHCDQSKIRDTLIELQKLNKFNRGIGLMKGLKILEHILPEVERLKNVQQGITHHAEGNVFRHTMMVLNNLKGRGKTLQIAGLLHDIGKPLTRRMVGDRVTFHDHDSKGGPIVEKILTRLEFDKPFIRKVKTLVMMHMRPFQMHNKSRVSWTSKAVRRFLDKLRKGIDSEDQLDDMIEKILFLSKSDTEGRLKIDDSGKQYRPKDTILPLLRKKIRDVRRTPEIDFNTPKRVSPLLKGKEVMDILNIKPSPEVGMVMKLVVQIQTELDAPTKEEVIQELKRRYKDGKQLS